MLSEEDQKERLSHAYVRIVAAAAKCDVTEVELDRFSIDVELKKSIPGAKVVPHPGMALQLKATSKPKESPDGSAWRIRISQKNYNDLRASAMVPQYLVLLVLPEDIADWIEHTPDALAIRRCCYWVSLLGLAERTGLAPATDIEIEVPKANRFDVDWLNQTMKVISEEGVKVA